jgi:hypothetical protein
LGAYEAFYIHAILFNTRSAVVSIEWVSTALEQISRDLSGDALAQVVGAGLVAPAHRQGSSLHDIRDAWQAL